MKSISLPLDGGIGNLLFQYCAALTLEKSGFRVSMFEESKGLLSRLNSYIGMEVNLEIPEKFILQDSSGNYSIPVHEKQENTFLSRTVRPYRRFTTNWIPDFDERPTTFGLRVKRLSGYFQHHTWYQPSIDEVLDHLLIKRSSLHLSTDYDVAIHLRRSDYVRLGWDLPLEYYSASLLAVPNLRNYRIGVFSDDSVVKQLFELHLRNLQYDVPESKKGSTAREDFFRMSLAGTLIMSNSTFSWWAAKLAKHQSSNKSTVIAPGNWLPNYKSQSLLCENWIQIPIK